MAGAIIWPGSGSNTISGSTPFGLYDNDSTFVSDGTKIQVWVARRLGYPIQDVELENYQIATCFEEAISEYSAQVNAFNIRNNMNVLRGAATGSNLSGHDVVGSPTPYIIRLSDDYGTEAGVGGNVTWKTGSINVASGSPRYNLNAFASVSESGNAIEIKRIFNDGPPAISKFFDPFSSGGTGARNLLTSFGFGAYSPASQFVLMPLYEDVLRAQAIEISDSIRKSAYSFELINNQLRLFPTPTTDFKLHFHYIVESERSDNAISRSRSGTASDYSNVPYQAMTYSLINEVGKQWIRKYTLALCKEVLGGIREKFGTIPAPGNEISLDGAALRSEAQTEKDALILQLRETLEELTDKNQMTSMAEQSDQHQQMLNKIPLKIYVGALLPWILFIIGAFDGNL